MISQRLVSKEFMATTGMHILDGRDFELGDAMQLGDNGVEKDSTRAMNVVITASMQKLLGKGSAVGKLMLQRSDRGTFEMRVIGVIKDYVYGDMYGESAPVVFYEFPQAASLLYIKTTAKGNVANQLAKIGGIMKKDNPAYPFEYKFVDDQFNQLFLRETLISKLSRVFASLAIIISCLGLFGLAAYTAERRIKEIGIRKVLGASVTGITTLLSKDFLQLVAVSCIVAFPIAWWMMSDWLQAYQYRITISWWIFAIAGVMAVGIALVTVSFQAVKAAVANPVESLRAE